MLLSVRRTVLVAVPLLMSLTLAGQVRAQSNTPATGAETLAAQHHVLAGESEALQGGGQQAKPETKPVASRVLVLHATNEGGGIDGKLRHLTQLTKPPFSSYDTYRLLSTHAMNLEPKQASTIGLPNGRALRTELKEVLAENRYRIAASISRPAPKGEKNEDKNESYLPLLEVSAKKGEYFFVAGQSYRGGILVLGIQVGAETGDKDGGKGKAPAKPGK